ncbi:unnamed protein product [Rotaria magnacalcarata]|uniref:Homeobox domain-containing protein n=1 Tax=Rotaria magnacalcarata TaxID=392030 RepID=A0A815V2F2_9BILA|nr:unnamed protein product [Rotaria magnacalcarata]CAF4021541.1 unnamed protein product [Rotaria magnacalcarata]
MPPTSMSYTYPYYYSPATSSCPCCLSSFYQQQSAALSPSPPYDNYHQTPSSTTTTQNIDIYLTNCFNELFQRIPYPNASQRDLVARHIGKTSEQIRIWFQNRRRLQTLRDYGEPSATTQELTSIEQGKIVVDSNELRTLLREISKFKKCFTTSSS